jgi:hypothetical protein
LSIAIAFGWILSPERGWDILGIKRRVRPA